MSITFSQILLSPLTWIFFVFGSILGSFANVCIYRLPREIFWRSHRSFCPHCEVPIPFWWNLPIFGFLLLRGKTHCCDKAIPRYYPLVELFCGLMVSYIYWHFPFWGNELPLMPLHIPTLLRFLHALVFAYLLLIASVIDMQHMIIPDVISLPMVAVAPLIAWLHPDLTLRSSGLGILLGGGVFFLVGWIYIVLRRKEGMGMGDVKLLGAIGGWLGYEALLPTILFASISGTVLSLSWMLFKREWDMQAPIPFGPFLATGAAFYLLAPMHWLEAISHLQMALANALTN